MKKIIPFLKYKTIAFIVSAILLVTFSVGIVLNKGFNFGIDFVGGVKIIAKFEKDADEKKIRELLKKFKPTVQKIGTDEKNEYIISTKLNIKKFNAARQKMVEAQKKNALKNNQKNDKKKKEELQTIEDYVKLEAKGIRVALKAKFPKVEFLSIETVGPAIGDFLRKSAGKLMAIAVILMMIYLAFRFEVKYSMGAMAALVHDIGLSVLFCGFVGVEFSIPVIAAILTIFGYSVNDTIVIFDRIRENVESKSKMSATDIVNQSISQSVSRTLLTSLTTTFTVLALYLIGGDVLNDFALVLLFGILVGTYSSVYVASPVLVFWEKIKGK